MGKILPPLLTAVLFWFFFLPYVYSRARVGLADSCLSKKRYISVDFPEIEVY